MANLPDGALRLWTVYDLTLSRRAFAFGRLGFKVILPRFVASEQYL